MTLDRNINYLYNDDLGWNKEQYDQVCRLQFLFLQYGKLLLCMYNVAWWSPFFPLTVCIAADTVKSTFNVLLTNNVQSKSICPRCHSNSLFGWGCSCGKSSVDRWCLSVCRKCAVCGRGKCRNQTVCSLLKPAHWWHRFFTSSKAHIIIYSMMVILNLGLALKRPWWFIRETKS